MDPQKSIRSFYEDKVIFITGGSGFLGKVLIEKLLRSCPNVRKIYILLRSKKGRSSEERIKSLFNMEVFRKFSRSLFCNFLSIISLIFLEILIQHLFYQSCFLITAVQSIEKQKSKF